MLIRFNFEYGYTVPKREMAFSQPTQMGRKLFMKYTQDRAFLTYK